MDKKCVQLKKDLLSYQDISDSLDHNLLKLRSIVDTDGLVVLIDGKISSSGSVPTDDCILKIAKWAADNCVKDHYFNDSFYKDLGNSLGLDKNCCGIALSFLNRTKGHLVIWFRGEYKHHISWAGKKEQKFRKIKLYDEYKLVV